MKSIFVVLAVFLVLGANAASVFEQDLTSEEIERYGFPGLDKVICKACEEVIRKVKREMGRESSREEIKDWLDRACTIIPVQKYRAKCRDAAKGEKGDQIVDAIIGNVEPNQICKLMSLC